MNICVDFNHTIHDADHPITGRKMGAPMDYTKQALTLLKERGFRIIVFTTWKPKSFKAIEDFMKYYELPFDEVTNIKPEAEYYIDNKAIQFTNWQEVLPQI